MYPNNQLQTTSPHRSHTLRLIVLVVGITLIAFGTVLQIHKLATTPTCFTANDYIEFYGSAPDDKTLKPGAVFFNSIYNFIPGSTTLDATESELSPEKDIANFNAFYKKYSSKQVLFIINATYATGSASNKAVVEKRVENIKKLLTDTGIAADLITTKIEAYEAAHQTVDDDNANSVSLTIKSAETCRE